MWKKVDANMVGNRIGTMSDLPEVIRDNVAKRPLINTDNMVIKTITDRYDGIASFNEIMVGLYRDFNHTVTSTKALSTRLRRLVSLGELEIPEGMQCVFRIPDDKLKKKSWKERLKEFLEKAKKLNHTDGCF